MKKLLFLSAMLATVNTFAQTASVTKEIKLSEKSFLERTNIWWFGVLEKPDPSKENNLSLLNIIGIDYQLAKKTTFRFNPRFSLTEGAGDEFAESDTRLHLLYDTYDSADGKLNISNRIFFDVPHTEGSEDSEKITQMRLFNTVNYKIDDFNTFTMWNMFNKVFNQRAESSVDSTSRHAVFNWLSIANSYFSEKVALRLDYNQTMEHIAGNADNSFINTDENFQLGANVNALGLSLFPYIQVNVGKGSIVAADQLGVGVQIFRMLL